MADKVTLMKQWFDTIKEDENLGEITEEQMAYIIYAAVNYGFSSEKINIGAVFGKENQILNFIMPNIYSQIDNIQKYDPKNGKIKYDAEAIKNLRLQGFKAREICEKLGYPLDKEKSISSNKGWIEAGKIIKQNPEKYRSVQKDTTVSIQIQNTDSVQNSTDMVQNDTDSVQNAFDF